MVLHWGITENDSADAAAEHVGEQANRHLVDIPYLLFSLHLHIRLDSSFSSFTLHIDAPPLPIYLPRRTTIPCKGLATTSL